jgi:hypothetical protein
MYCPHCGREMVLRDEVFTCTAGGMGLSRRVHQTLSERFPVQRPRTARSPVRHELTRWFCPGCGVPLDRQMRCPACEQSIADLLFPLVELHPHQVDR